MPWCFLLGRKEEGANFVPPSCYSHPKPGKAVSEGRGTLQSRVCIRLKRDRKWFAWVFGIFSVLAPPIISSTQTNYVQIAE